MLNKIKRALCVLSAAAVIASVSAGCQSKNTNTGTGTSSVADEQTMAKELSYKVENVSVPENYTVSKICMHGGMYYASCDDGNKRILICFDDTGAVKWETVVREDEEGGNTSSLGVPCIDDAGNITAVISTITPDYTQSTFEIVKFTNDGTLTDTIDITKSMPNEGKNVWLMGYVQDKSGALAINFGETITVVDAAGGKIGDITVNGDTEYVISLVVTNKGEPAYVSMNFSAGKSKITTIDTKTAHIGKEYMLDGLTAYAYDGTGDYLCYIQSDTGIGGIKEDGSRESVVNLLNLGVNNSDIESVAVGDDKTFLTIGYDQDLGRTAVTRIKPSDVKIDKTIVTLGCFNINYVVRNSIARFNKTNDKYVIYVNSYADKNDTSNEEAAMTKFNNEILTGNIPDILLVDPAMPYDSYVAKGLFTDLYPLIDADPDISRDDLMPNVLSAYEKDGKLMSIAPVFNLYTNATSGKYVDENGFLTLSKSKEITEALGDAKIGGVLTKAEFLKNAMYFSDFIDFGTGKCDFDNPAFISILEESNKHPLDNESDWMSDPDSREENMMALKNGKDVIYNLEISGLDLSYELPYFPDDFTFTNFPTDRPTSKALIAPRVTFAISEKSTHKDAAFKFIEASIKTAVEKNPREWYDIQGNRHRVEDDIEYSSWYGLPIYRPDFELVAEHATDPFHYYDEKGKAIYETRTIFLNGSQIKIPDPTKEQVQKYVDAVENCNTRIPSIDEIFNTIVRDEAQNYWSGTSTAENTAQVIQSRVTLYMSEHY